MAGVCGKDCIGCAYRQQYGCRGCLETGGHPVWGSCRVAACCHSQGRQNCGECPSHDGCGKPDEMETTRQQWARDEENRCVDWREGLARRICHTEWGGSACGSWPNGCRCCSGWAWPLRY